MRIAIIGGGASGLIAAYLLDRVHAIDLYERQPVLGGNVRTLACSRGNIPCASLPPDLAIENGVTGFHEASSSNFRALLEHLQVPIRHVSPSSGIFLRRQRPLILPTLDQIHQRGMRRFFLGRAEARVFGLEMMATIAKLRLLPPSRLRGRTLEDLLPRRCHPLAIWLRGLIMEAFSAPYQDIAAMPAEIAGPLLLAGLIHPHWFVIAGGAFTYMQRIVDRIQARILLRAQIREVRRDPAGAIVRIADGTRRRYDKIIFAVTPGQVLKLVGDPTDDERAIFAPWSDQQARTLAHTDVAFYRHPAPQMSTFDFFQRADGNIGYNCNLNETYGINHQIRYSFAYGLEEMINPRHVLDVAEHTVPRYSVEGMASRRQLIAQNGSNHCYFVGAYLGDGLHEGATTSAIGVAQRLGSRTFTKSRANVIATRPG